VVLTFDEVDEVEEVTEVDGAYDLEDVLVMYIFGDVYWVDWL